MYDDDDEYDGEDGGSLKLAMKPHLQPGSLPVGHTVELEQSWNVGKSNLIEDYDETKQNIKKFV